MHATNASLTSNTVGPTVNKAATTTALASSLNPSLDGQAVTFTATVMTVAPGTGIPGGTVEFMDGATPPGAPVLFGDHSLQVDAHGGCTFIAGAVRIPAVTADRHYFAKVRRRADDLLGDWSPAS